MVREARRRLGGIFEEIRYSEVGFGVAFSLFEIGVRF